MTGGDILPFPSSLAFLVLLTATLGSGKAGWFLFREQPGRAGTQRPLSWCWEPPRQVCTEATATECPRLRGLPLKHRLACPRRWGAHRLCTSLTPTGAARCPHYTATLQEGATTPHTGSGLASVSAPSRGCREAMLSPCQGILWGKHLPSCPPCQDKPWGW